MANRVAAYRSGMVPWAALLTSLVVGCAERSPIDNHDTSLPDGGAPAIDSATADATEKSDVLSPPVPPSDADAVCTCTAGDGGGSDLGVVGTLGCFCAWPNACRDYATALASCRPFLNDRLEVYAACNLEVMRFPGTYDAGSVLVYDATTHELVGGWYASDTPAFECGALHVIGRKAGIFPPAGCAMTRSVQICGTDAG